MVIDTSAVIAILRDEPERAELNAMLASADDPVISAATLVESRIVACAKFGPDGRRAADELLSVCGTRCIAVDFAQSELATEAWMTYGKGRHPAGLNFGDCFSYALARLMQRRLLFQGADFPKTDVVPAASGE